MLKIDLLRNPPIGSATPALFLLSICVFLSLSPLGCSLLPEKVSLDDNRVIPLLRAMERVDRASMGFSEISEQASIKLEGPSEDYDAMLHIDEGRSSRTVAFRLTDGEYEWLAEQLTYWGPKDYVTLDGTMKEHVTITFEAGPVSISGVPVGRSHISYTGEDHRLASKAKLELKDIESVIAEWTTQGQDGPSRSDSG